MNNQDFDELTWRFFAKTENIAPSKVPFFMGDSREGMIDFAGWSSDSGRLLVALRGGDFDGQRTRGVYRWFVYFNTKNQNFEITNYLRRLNKGAWDRYANFSEDNPDVGLVQEVIAEPLSELPSEAESKKRYEKADRHLNELYQKVSKQGVRRRPRIGAGSANNGFATERLARSCMPTQVQSVRLGSAIGFLWRKAPRHTHFRSTKH